MKRVPAALVLLLAAGCAQHLPDQDLRILQATPVAKLSTDVLWKDYQADKRAADGRYHGKAIDISGKVTGIVLDPPRPAIMFGQSGAAASAGVEARLLDDRAGETAKELTAGQRVTLRCFVEGLETNVVLKSCYKP